MRFRGIQAVRVFFFFKKRELATVDSLHRDVAPHVFSSVHGYTQPKRRDRLKMDVFGSRLSGVRTQGSIMTVYIQ